MHVISGRFSVLMNFEFFLSYLRTDHAQNYLFCIMICHCLCNFLMYSTKVRRKWKIRCQNFDRLYGWFAEGERACCPTTIIYSLIFFVHCFYFLHAHWSIFIPLFQLLIAFLQWPLESIGRHFTISVQCRTIFNISIRVCNPVFLLHR